MTPRQIEYCVRFLAIPLIPLAMVTAVCGFLAPDIFDRALWTHGLHTFMSHMFLVLLAVIYQVVLSHGCPQIISRPTLAALLLSAISLLFWSLAAFMSLANTVAQIFNPNRLAGIMHSIYLVTFLGLAYLNLVLLVVQVKNWKRMRRHLRQKTAKRPPLTGMFNF